MEFIASQPLLFDNNEKMALALALKVPFDKIDDVLSDVHSLFYDKDRRYLLMNNYSQYGNIYYDNKNPKGRIYTSEKNKDNLFLVMVKIYAIRTYNNPKITDLIVKKFNNNINVHYDILYYIKQIKSIQKDIVSKISKYGNFNLPSISENNKLLKKLKIKIEKRGEDTYYHIGAIRCGDDIEGYINYRDIAICLDEDYDLIAIHYYFKNWDYNSKWDWSTITDFTLHPHTTSNSICFGNRDSDAMLYTTQMDLPFLLLTYKEALSCYNSGSAYSKIKDIAPILRALDGNSDMIQYPTDQMSEEEKMIYYVKKIMKNARKCPKCGNYYYGNYCETQDCIKNPLTVKSCPSCDSKMIWDESTQQLKCPTCYTCPACGTISKDSTYCQNIKCDQSPLYKAICRICGGIVTTKIVNGIRKYYCDNPLCECSEERFGKTEILQKLSEDKELCPLCNEKLEIGEMSSNWICRNHENTISCYNQYGSPLFGRTVHTNLREEYERIDYNITEYRTIDFCPYCKKEGKHNRDILCSINNNNEVICQTHGIVGDVIKVLIPYTQRGTFEKINLEYSIVKWRQNGNSN